CLATGFSQSCCNTPHSLEILSLEEDGIATQLDVVSSIEGFIFDLDGTVYRGDELLPGAKQVVDELREKDKGPVFLSNKALERRSAYARQLTRLGVPTDVDQIINSSLVTARYLVERDPDAPVYVIGEGPLIEELENHGIEISVDPGEIRYVVASFDRDFHYDKLRIAYDAIKNGAGFIATNADRTCPVKGGEVPDAAGMIGAIEGVTGKKLEMIAGKPSTYMLQSALDILELDSDSCLLVGDRLETDIRMALDHNITAVLVLTGVTDREDLQNSPIKPDYVLETLEDFPSIISL
ncbi:MAG: HAD-IIA family hydrolase, partial [Candidatus Acetothermia bacterium]